MANQTSILSQIEFNERVNGLPTNKQLTYRLLNTAVLAGMFSLLVIAGILILALVDFMRGNPLDPPGYVWLAFPVALAMSIAIGFSGNAMPDSVHPADTLWRVAQRAGRGGLVTGGMAGFSLGGIWGIIDRMHLFVGLTTMIEIDINRVILEILIYSLLLALVIAPLFGLFRAFSSISGQLILKRVEGK